jgi:hypothetical protein
LPTIPDAVSPAVEVAVELAVAVEVVLAVEVAVVYFFFVEHYVAGMSGALKG